MFNETCTPQSIVAEQNCNLQCGCCIDGRCVSSRNLKCIVLKIDALLVVCSCFVVAFLAINVLVLWEKNFLYSIYPQQNNDLGSG